MKKQVDEQDAVDYQYVFDLWYARWHSDAVTIKKPRNRAGD